MRQQVAKALYRNTMNDLFGRLQSPRKRVMSSRHVQILNLMLDEEEISLEDIIKKTSHLYTVKNPRKALIRDLGYLLELEAVHAIRPAEDQGVVLSINLDWPMQITETEFFRRIKEMPKGKVYGFLSR